MNALDPLSQFAARPPSMSWEAIPLADAPQCFVWVWFKPPQMPFGLVLTIPDETFQANLPQVLTVRNVLRSVGLDPAWVAMWTLYGAVFDPQQGANPILDQAIPPPMPGVDRNIFVGLHAAASSPFGLAGYPPQIGTAIPFVGQALPAQVTPTVTGNSAVMLERISSEWHACLHLEKELETLRKQLGNMATKLSSLNRDLTPEESLHSTREDRDDWQDARRWLREAASRVSRFIKEMDVGETTYSGKKQWFESIYEQHVVPRQPFNGIEQAQQDFEAHRKTLQTLINNMRSAHNGASSDGERRAQQVLSRIASKVNAARSKR